MHATLQPALSVGWLVSRLVGRSVTFYFFYVFFSLDLIADCSKCSSALVLLKKTILVIFGHFVSFPYSFSVCSKVEMGICKWILSNLIFFPVRSKLHKRAVNYADQ